MITEKRREQTKAWRQANKEKACQYSKKWRDNNLEKSRQVCRNYRLANLEKERARCKKKDLTEKGKQYRRDWYRKNIIKMKEYYRKRNSTPEAKIRTKMWKQKRLSIPANRIIHALKAIKRRATDRKMSFDAALFAIAEKPPKKCACCKTELDYSAPKRSRYNRCLSFDRIDNNKGYTIANVAIICTRCNYIKSDATIEELKFIVAYIKREIRQNKK